MPGPGPHMIYTLGSGLGLMVASNGRFSPHHCFCYSINAFFGPDIGSFLEWLTSTVGFGDTVVSAVADYIHHPFYYVVLLSLPLSLLYSWASRVALQKGILDSLSGVPLTRLQCFLLISAGSFSHFFLDHLFEENGKSSVYTWILSTGWWVNRAPINPDAVIVISLLCTGLILGFIYIHRVGPSKSIKTQYTQSVKLIITIAALYCLWCASQIYLVQPRRPAVGEEADLGVLPKEMWQSKQTKWPALVLGLIMFSVQLVEGCPNDSIFVMLVFSVFGVVMAIKRRIEMKRLASKGYDGKGSIRNTRSINSAVTVINCRSKYEDEAGNDGSTRTCSFQTLSGNQSRKWNNNFASNLRNGSRSMGHHIFLQ